MSKLWIVPLAVAGIAAAQGIDLGVLAGAGGFTASGPTLAAGQVGVEACVFCTGRFGVFGEYSHWFTSGVAQGYNPSDVVAILVRPGHQCILLSAGEGQKGGVTGTA